MTQGSSAQFKRKSCERNARNPLGSLIGGDPNQASRCSTVGFKAIGRAAASDLADV